MKRSLFLSTAIAVLSMGAVAHAETLRWALAGDALTLDPHAQNEA